MNPEAYEVGFGEVSIKEAEVELKRLLSDARFRVSERQRGILRYLAKRRFEGLREGAKAYSIALDVLGRSSGFDASTDPIVRIEISRLRTALDSYYAVFGLDTGVSVYIPKGSYVVLFPKMPMVRESDIEAEAEEDLQPRVTAMKEAPGRAAMRRNAPRRWQLVATGVGVMALGGIAGWSMSGKPDETEKPTVILAMSAVSPDMAAEAGMAKDMLVTALMQFQTVVVARPSSLPGKGEPDYEIDLKYYADSGDRSVWWQVIDVKRGTVLKSGLEKVEVEGWAPSSVREEMANALARQIASTGGVINSAEIRQAPQDALGNVCILRAELALEEGRSGDLAAARKCLERTLADRQNDPDTAAVLARTFAQDASGVPQAMELAKRAAASAPLSDRAQAALMSAQFAAGNIGAAIEAGNRAMELNPNNASSAATLSLILFSAGYWQAAPDLARNAIAKAQGQSHDATLVLALEAYRNGRWSEASLLAEQASGDEILSRSLRAAALGELGAESAQSRLLELKMDVKDFGSVFQKNMAVARMRPEVVDGLKAGLIKAGVRFDSVERSFMP